jgi:hypothetical protein
MGNIRSRRYGFGPVVRPSRPACEELRFSALNLEMPKTGRPQPIHSTCRHYVLATTRQLEQDWIEIADHPTNVGANMKTSIKVFLATIVLAFTFNSSSQAGPPWFETTAKIKRLGTGLNGEGLYVQLDVLTNNNTCNHKDSLLLTTGHQQFQETVSILLLAFSQSRPIDVFYDGSCWGDNVQLFAAAIRNSP